MVWWLLKQGKKNVRTAAPSGSRTAFQSRIHGLKMSRLTAVVVGKAVSAYMSALWNSLNFLNWCE